MTDGLAPRPPQSFADILKTTRLSPTAYKAMWGVSFEDAMAAMRETVRDGNAVASALTVAGHPITKEALKEALRLKAGGEPIYMKMIEPNLPVIMAAMPWWWRMRFDLMAQGLWNWHARRWWKRRIKSGPNSRRSLRHPSAAHGRGRRDHASVAYRGQGAPA